MAKKEDTLGLTVKKDEDTTEWYEQVILKSELADFAPVKGCMVIRPRGYALWQKITDVFNEMIKNNGVENAYFPLFIPESFFQKEAKHAEGFKAEVAWVEKNSDEGERLAVRPTSETIMYDSYSKWIRSWRDLPLKINQWCNVVRWEVSDCKLFLRSREFLWQEGHCVYETDEECDKDTLHYSELYRQISEELLAIAVISGRKTEKEKFAGANKTYTIEGFSPEGKAVQMGTSHNLGQNFAKAFDIKFIGKDEKKRYPFQNSWGISTRMIGALVMIHSDDKGLVLPPKIAPLQIVIVPILFDKTKKQVLKKANEIKITLKKYTVKLDDREEYNPGWKFNNWELKGVPLRIEFGPKDLEKDQAVIVRRDTGKKEFIKIRDIEEKTKELLETMQKDMLEKSRQFLKQSIVEVDTWEEFMKAAKDKKLIKAGFCNDIKCEEELKSKSGGAGSRCIPFDEKIKKGTKCIHCNKPAEHIAYFARSY